jgi:uncharacterized protein (TIGR02594 family)
MIEAERNLSVREVPGSGNNPTIIGWAKKLGGWIASYYKQDSIPWCGLFVNYCMAVAGAKTIQSGLGALNWATYGVGLGMAIPGAILVFKRPGGGHVGFYVSEDNDTFHVLGGNQSDAVTITKIAKNRLVATRWPSNFKVPPGARPIHKKFDGKLSVNEK